MKLVIVHHHFRPGGVRRVIELATPHLVAHWPERIRGVVLATGETPDAAWLRAFRQRLHGTPVQVVIQPAFGYVAELRLAGQSLRRRVLDGIMGLLRESGGDDCLIWAHNFGLGRNLCFARELTFTFPQCYREVRVDPALFDWRGERQRQTRLFAEWKDLMPRAAAKLAGKPAILAAEEDPCPVPFSRLTLTAQLEVLAQPSEQSWERCAPLNPFLKKWRERALAGRLETSPWPRSAERWLEGCAYARRFLELVPPLLSKAPRAGASQAAQAEFLHKKLRVENLYPLLWNSRT